MSVRCKVFTNQPNTNERRSVTHTRTRTQTQNAGMNENIVSTILVFFLTFFGCTETNKSNIDFLAHFYSSALPHTLSLTLYQALCFPDANVLSSLELYLSQKFADQITK